MKYGLVGAKLGHSYSAIVHGQLGAQYELMPLSEEKLEEFITKREFEGINVTIPYKESVLAMLDVVDKRARDIGAVNTIVNRSGILHGYNTDYDGMRYIVERSGVDIVGTKVAILGSGGTAKTARLLMQDLGAQEIVIVSRSGEYCYTNVEKWSDVDVIINTTPYGMYPDFCEAAIVQCSDFKCIKLVIDAIYNPLRTALVCDARAQGVAAFGGVDMLIAQAVAAAKYFGYGKGADTVKIASEIVRAEQNIVLVGMPSSGKSFVGVKIAEMLSRPFYDSDKIFAERHGMSAGEMIRSEGEAAFRARESDIVKELSLLRGVVISTGGGAVLSQTNRYYLKANGCVVYLQRDVYKLAVGGDRPLSTGAVGLQKMFELRDPIYSAIADCVIDNNCNYGTGNIIEFVRWYNENTCY